MWTVTYYILNVNENCCHSIIYSSPGDGFWTWEPNDKHRFYGAPRHLSYKVIWRLFVKTRRVQDNNEIKYFTIIVFEIPPSHCN